jgi:hypothetical protein
MTSNSGRATAAKIFVVLAVAFALTTFARDAAATVLTHDALTPARTDGKGAVAWFASPGILHVRDQTADVEFDVDVAAGCTTPPTSLLAVGGGEVLFACNTGRVTQSGATVREPRLLDIARRTIVVPAGVAGLLDVLTRPLDSIEFTGIGTRGLRYIAGTYHSEYQPGTIDWRTGESVYGDGSETSVPDLDSPTLLTTLCEPLHQHQLPFYPYRYEQPYGLYDGPHTALTLEHCGSTRRMVLERRDRRSRAVDAQLGGGFVIWFVVDPTEVPPSPSALRAYLPACDLRLAWDLAPGSSVAHLYGRIVRSTPSQSSKGRWSIQTTPIGGMCVRTAAIWTARIASGRQHRIVPATSGSFRFANRILATRQTAPAAHNPPLELQAGARVRIGFGAALRSLRWRIGDGRWHAAAIDGAYARLRPNLRGARVLHLDGRFRRGGRVRVEIPVAPLR